MPRGATYANNAANISSGRAGMAMGSAVQSSSRSSGGSYASSSSRSYVDNSQNRSLGRVGMSLGSQPVSSSSPSAKTYVDNSQNRSLGRVGMSLGSQPVSRSSPSTKTYVDNSQNRSLGRVGMSLGSQPVSSSSVSRQPVEKTGYYIDNPYNRTLGRVGLKYGSVTAPVFQQKLASTSEQKKLYVDNAANRRLGRVGKPVGSAPASLSRGDYMKKAYQHLQNNEFDDEFDLPLPRSQYNQDGEDDCYGQKEEVYQDRITELMRRLEAWEMKSNSGMPEPSQDEDEDESESYSGAVIRYEDMELGHKIGHGGFGDVFHATWNDLDVAVKKLRVQRVSRKRLSQFTNEVILFSKLKHANIIGFFGACMITPNICMVMELMQGSLYDMIHIEEKQFESEDKIEILRDIASGLAYLHDDIKMAHCDMKSENVLLAVDQNDDSIIVKITDFGLSMLKQDTDVTTSSDVRYAKNIGTPRYSAPEILRGEFLDIKAFMKADIYAFGLIMHEVFSEEVPFEGLNIHQLHKLVGEGTHTLDFQMFIEKIDESFVDMMRSCWDRNPEQRPTADEICKQLSL